MTDQKISAFDIYEYLPHTNCKNCGEKLLQGKKNIGGCSALRGDQYEKNRQEIQTLIDVTRD